MIETRTTTRAITYRQHAHWKDSRTVEGCPELFGIRLRCRSAADVAMTPRAAERRLKCSSSRLPKLMLTADHHNSPKYYILATAADVGFSRCSPRIFPPFPRAASSSCSQHSMWALIGCICHIRSPSTPFLVRSLSQPRGLSSGLKALRLGLWVGLVLQRGPSSEDRSK